jgi:hypothetical protein
MCPHALAAAATTLAVFAWACPATAADSDDGSNGTPLFDFHVAPSGTAWHWRSGQVDNQGATSLATPALEANTLAGFGSTMTSPVGGGGNAQGWSVTHGAWTFASLVSAPFIVQPAAIDGRSPGSRQSDAYATGIVALVPVVASYRFSQTDRIAVSVGMNVPDSHMQENRYAATESGMWATTPKVALTKVVSTADFESSTVVAIGTFSRKAVQDYQNGAVGRIEALVMKQNASGWGYGGVAAAIQQVNYNATFMPNRSLNTDGGSMSWGVGPQVTWTSRWLGSGVDFQCRWLYEFHSANGHPDQPMLLSARLHL